MFSGAHDDLEYFWVTQGILTPDAKDIIWGVASSLKTRLALGMTKARAYFMGYPLTP
jgi:hypothetical protein